MTKVKTESGKVFEADYVFQSIGNKPNVQIVEAADKGAIDSGLIRVDEYLRVSGLYRTCTLTDDS